MRIQIVQPKSEFIISFVIAGDLNPEEITQQLGISPTTVSVIDVGQKHSGIWKLVFETSSNQKCFEQIRFLLDVLTQPKQKRALQALHGSGVVLRLMLEIGAEEMEGLAMPPELLAKMAHLNIRLHLIFEPMERQHSKYLASLTLRDGTAVDCFLTEWEPEDGYLKVDTDENFGLDENGLISFEQIHSGYIEEVGPEPQALDREDVFVQALDDGLSFEDDEDEIDEGEDDEKEPEMH